MGKVQSLIQARCDSDVCPARELDSPPRHTAAIASGEEQSVGPHRDRKPLRVWPTRSAQAQRRPAALDIEMEVLDVGERRAEIVTGRFLEDEVFPAARRRGGG
jgi:hypothetical protein